MKILHILDHSIPLHSGYTFRTRAILTQQAALGWRTVQLTSGKQGPTTDAVEEVDGLSFYRTPAPSGTMARLPGYGAQKLGAPAVARPNGEGLPYRSLEPSEHRGDLVVTYVIEGETQSDVHYQALGIPPTASASEIDEAYRRMALATHPDRNPDDPEALRRFEAAEEAYVFLTGRTREPATKPDRQSRAGLALFAIGLGLSVAVWAVLTMLR